MKIISIIIYFRDYCSCCCFFWSEDKGPKCYQISDEQARKCVKMITCKE